MMTRKAKAKCRNVTFTELLNCQNVEMEREERSVMDVVGATKKMWIGDVAARRSL